MVSYNIKFPLNDDVTTNTYFALTKTTKDALTSDLLLLLLTQKGERYYEPDYGTDLLRFIFEPNDNLVQSDIEQEIKRTVSSYIPALKIDRITFNKNVDDQGLPMSESQLNVYIKFTYTEDTFSETGELELNF
ncbi:MAG: GPW/gp25 family protein [Dehalococcoidia bacterium]|jgi:phage baseplate assembly protein W